jgi:hypothetical protein
MVFLAPFASEPLYSAHLTAFVDAQIAKYFAAVVQEARASTE